MFKLIASAVLTLIFSFSLNAQIEVMSYNIKYANENDGENSWSLRKDHLANQIKFYQPDIFGVQEAVLEQLEYFEGTMPEYNYVGVGRDDGKTKGEFSAIFYDSNRFEVLKENTFWLSKTPDEISVGWDAALPRVCTYAKFRDKNSGENFWVFNTHFDHMGEEAREESARLIWKKMQELNSEGLPVILMGDLNLEPNAPGIKFLSEKLNDSKTIAELDFGPEGTFNGYNFLEPVKRRIDYIFTSKVNIEVLKYAVLSDSWDLKYPSDHLPVLVQLKFK
ncbi:endonuclease/exonuclease/phosphatase family protein [Gillisia limnaea]|uniref:Endonuclease/exonuclease/phosphatase n=1 Tax=Gillisia limnaea (strain DSM 15749 / LMG 21470 / R-8282) TaxID=865937 RepID=H2BUN9_GILLR|nr:endonuclease/exonuclease/phosphatase family protein [Gillisia limnaea]EHQ01694.1 Endonuclease/exonuclease/phosphatase [Gillisia limnaea DSM 15749]